MTTRAIHLSLEQAEALDMASRFCGTLAAVERAHALDDLDSVVVLLDGLDPIEIQLTANVLQSLFMLWRSLPPTTRSGPMGVVPGSPPHDAPAALDGGRSSAPTPTSLDAWRVPCA
jgi:hypothetical protein